MGRSNHASFSFRGKPNLHLLKKKFKIKSIRETLGKKKEGGKDEQLCRKEERAWKRFWWKWLGFVRGHRAGAEAAGRDGGGAVDPGAVVKADEDLEMNATSMDVIEIPIEPGQKISKILIKPTKTGIKALIAQCRKSPHPCPPTPTLGHRELDDEDARWVARVLTRSGSRLSDVGAGDKKRLNSRWTTFKSMSGWTRTSETTLPTSALFIRENMDDVAESSVFIEPNLPNDYPDSRKSDDLSQKSAKINKRRVSYRILGEKNNEIQNTFKTVSEPTWFERKNIFRRRRLQEDINDLLEQFLFLESEDVIGLTVPSPNGPATDDKDIEFDAATYLGTKDHSVKEICREVSPEVLVNIKPFKEYLSDDYLGDAALSVLGHLHGEKSSRRSLSGQGRSAKKKGTNDPVSVGRSEECVVHPPVDGASISKESQATEVLRGRSAHRNGVRGESAAEREAMQACFEECPGPAALSRVGQPSGALRGVRKPCGACAEGRTSGAEKRSETKKESLDELLETLDDSDHDVVFRKNMSQFRKKINVVPRLDPRKKEHKKTKKQQSYLKFAKPIVECVVEELEEEEESWEQQQRRRSGALGVRSLEKWEGGRRLSRTLVTNVMLLSERNLVRRALASRVEEVMVSVVATWREMWSLMESGRCMVVQREKPGWGAGGPVRAKGAVEETSAYEENMKVVSRILGMQSEDSSLVHTSDAAVLGEAIPQALSFISSTRDSAYVSESSQFSDYQEISICDMKKLTLAEHSPITEQRDSSFKEEFLLISSEPAFGPPRGLVQILGNLTFNYVKTIDGSVEQCLSWPTCCQSHGDPGRHESVTGHGGGSDICPAEGSAKSRDRAQQITPQVDGFQILYNKNRENLNEDDDDAAKTESSKSLCDDKQTAVFTAGNAEKEQEKRERMHSDGDAEVNVYRFLKCKSSSSPKENIIQNEFGPQEHRMRRSLNFPKEFEKEFLNCKKRRPPVDKGAEIRRTGSASLESHCPKVSIQKESGFGRESKFTSLILSNEPKPKQGSDKQKISPTSDSGGGNVRKEVVAAFNSIKEINAGKGESKGGNKRMSLVIMFCKK